MRLDRFVSQAAGVSRSQARALILRGRVSVAGDTVKDAARQVGEADRVEHAGRVLRLPGALYLMLNKPTGLLSATHDPRQATVLTLLPPEIAARVHLVGRLDKDTSGLLLIARTLTAHTALVRALAERQISRHYLAVCNGVLTGGGRIDAPLGRHPVDRKRMAVREDGRPAVTHYRVLERFAAHTLVDVELETGRTHQIRVHFAHRQYPLVGDPVYGRRLAIPAGASERLTETLRGFRRQALHAVRLALEHPVTGEPMAFEKEPPADFADLVAALAEDAHGR